MIFSRRDFQKHFENFDDLFKVDQTDFPNYPKALKNAVLAKFSRHFLENFDKKNAFFWPALPLNLSLYWRP